MRKSCVIVAMTLSAFSLFLDIDPAAANEPDHSSVLSFSIYTRQQIVEVCLAEYGMENTSAVDCVAADEKFNSALAQKWSEIDNDFKKTCLRRFADQHVNSYFHLDHCPSVGEAGEGSACGGLSHRCVTPGPLGRPRVRLFPLGAAVA